MQKRPSDLMICLFLAISLSLCQCGSQFNAIDTPSGESADSSVDFSASSSAASAESQESHDSATSEFANSGTTFESSGLDSAAESISPEAGEIMGQCAWVHDGDTLTIAVDPDQDLSQFPAKIRSAIENNEAEVRLYGIDAPELNQAYGLESRDFAINLVYDRPIALTPTGDVSYGRIVGTIRSAAGMLNTTMLRNGLAWYYGNYCKDPTLCPEMAELENSAQENDLGLWLDPEPVNPGDYRYDDSFALCLKRQLGLSGNADLEDYKADIRALSVLDCSGQNIKSIVIDYSVGIGSFAGLKELNLANNQIVDVTILQYFEGLETLDLQQNHLWDIRPLGKLSHLLVLNLAENCIEDFSPVSGGTAEVTEVDQDPAKCGL